MPVSSLHPLPVNPTTGQQPFSSLSRASGSSVPLASAAGGGVNRDVLKGLQDVQWSDDEEDPDCLLCAEPLDLSDLNFKPCQCGLQICQFCYNKLLSTDARCPGCRRAYDAKAVIFQPVDWEEVKRAKEKKTRKAKTLRQLEQLGRRHLLNVRIVMKNTVYVVGMKLPAQGDEAIPILRTNDYFGQYGKIARLHLRVGPPDGIYVIYVRREDAARAIAALDGFPQGATVIKASYGTTRYCESFLKGTKCDQHQCTNLHEWGGDGDCFTKDDLDVAMTRPAEYDARQKQATITVPSMQKSAWPKPSASEEAIGSALPGSASWGKPVRVAPPVRRPVTKSNLVPLTKNTVAFPLPTPSPVPARREKRAVTMVRNRSNDTSATTSTAPSPRKKPISLSLKSDPPKPKPEPTPSVASSSAGPSTSPPITPARSPSPTLPAPLTSDPIFIHSPYEEPESFPFPATDPDFALDIGYREDDLGEHRFTPTRFDKIRIGLAELGILFVETTRRAHEWTGSFKPFDEEEPIDGPRTTSRFDFARPVSRAQSISRGQSPFTLRTQERNGASPGPWSLGLGMTMADSPSPAAASPQEDDQFQPSFGQMMSQQSLYRETPSPMGYRRY